ncbi:unnamed protein product, partial [Didymodactylos carnosus]
MCFIGCALKVLKDYEQADQYFQKGIVIFRKNYPKGNVLLEKAEEFAQGNERLLKQ